jgi:predicted O-methyltransferase YrrM
VGSIYTSELIPEKCAVAQRNFEEAGLSDFITLLEGDALETLPTVEGPIEFLLLDGWNDLYLPVLLDLPDGSRNRIHVSK